MIVGLVGQLLNMLLSFGGRMVFVHYLSQEYLGVNGLFGDVLGMLNLAELGIGSAMIFSMYRPAAQNDEKQLARLMNLYRTLYRIVALAVLGIGLALMPFLPLLMKGGEGIENLQLIYLLYLLQAVTSYLLSYKNAIYQAYQKAYIRKALDQIIGIVRLILQIVVLVTTRNFILYLIIQLFVPMVSSVIISIRADREFPYLKQYKELLSMDSVELEFTDEALHAIARKTIERKTGARGLRSVMEGILLPVMYDVPNDPTIIRVTIDKDTVEGGEAHLEYGAVRKRYKNQTTLS
mgnify:CR=1 FL=1